MSVYPLYLCMDMHVCVYPGCSCLNVCVPFVLIHGCVCVCARARCMSVSRDVCASFVSVHGRVVCTLCVCIGGRVCGLSMLILLGRCVEVVETAEHERPAVGVGRHCGLRPGLHPPDSPLLGSQFKRRVQESTQVLRELETSLRTNHIG